MVSKIICSSLYIIAVSSHTTISVSGCQELSACLLYQSALKKKPARQWPIQLELVARFQVLNYVRLNHFVVVVVVWHVSNQFSYWKEDSSVCFGRHFCSCFLLSCFCEVQKNPAKNIVIPCVLNVENLDWRMEGEGVWYVMKMVGSVLRRKRQGWNEERLCWLFLSHRLVQVGRDLRRPVFQPPVWSRSAY